MNFSLFGVLMTHLTSYFFAENLVLRFLNSTRFRNNLLLQAAHAQLLCCDE